ncbi:hypothetical protein ABZ858_34805 [Streptomyces sp. NPDC047017]|uniref:hypothetical protein n=1 Tax=Streptomyces sp. NPDC047017 TaxID=3155024 RepID=UPI0033F85C41
MEQRKGSSSQPLKNEPVTGAGFDPAFVPGLTSPAQARPRTEPETEPEAEAVAEPVETRPEEAAAPVTPAEDAVPDGPGPGAGSDAEDGEDAGEPDAEEPDGPVFEAADRRARIVADHRGVRLVLDDQECEFRWDEIAAVESATPRFGKRFTVTVHTPERRWYPIEIEAPSRSRFSEWETRLDAVLDAYFEDGEAEAETDESPKDESTKDGTPKDGTTKDESSKDGTTKDESSKDGVES